MSYIEKINDSISQQRIMNTGKMIEIWTEAVKVKEDKTFWIELIGVNPCFAAALAELLQQKDLFALEESNIGYETVFLRLATAVVRV